MGADYVFVDTSAFIALAAKKDKYHEDAARMYSELLDSHTNLVTTNHVVDEVCNRLLWDSTLGHKASRKFGDMVRDISTPFVLDETNRRLPVFADLVLVYPVHKIEGSAWDIFCKYDTAGFSYTDCVSFAVMQKLGIKKAFAFDHHFDILGFERL